MIQKPNCSKCGKEVEISNGGCAFMIAFCRKHTTSLINVSYCSDCYKTFVYYDLRNLNAVADLRIVLDDDEERK